MEQKKKASAPVFSVVIVSYRSGELWKQAVASVLLQDYPAVELILADDGTPDFSSADCERFIAEHCGANLVRSRVLTAGRNAGTVKNLNRANRLCSGDYLLHFAADDALADRGVLTAFAGALRRKKPGVLGVYGKSECCDEHLQPMGRCSFDPKTAERMNGFSAREQWKQLCRGCCIHMGATAFVREEFMRAGGFDPRFRLMEDWPFLLCSTRQGYTFEFIDFSALYYRVGGITQRKPTPGYRMLLSDHLLNYETHILPDSAKLDRGARLKVWMRYLDDRMDGHLLFAEAFAAPNGGLREIDAQAGRYLAVWWIKRNRRLVMGGMLLLLCLMAAVRIIK